MKDRKVRTYVGFTFALIVLAVIVTVSPNANAQQTNHVGLVVDFGGSHVTYCVEFSESEITGYDVLRRAGLDIIADLSNPMGAAICDINDTSGCPASNCFCQCQGSPCVYWSYHYLENGAWQYSTRGASDHKVHDGDVEGWGWGEGAINSSGHAPPVIPFDQICAPPATDTPVPTDTPIPPTDTLVPPTDTPELTNTPTLEGEATSIPAPEAWFRLDKNPVAAGACTMVRWDTSHAREVYLNEEVVNLNGSRQVCPTEPQTYQLRVVGAETETTYELVLGVTGTTTPGAGPTQTPSPTSPPSPALDMAGESPSPSPSPLPPGTRSPTQQVGSQNDEASSLTVTPTPPVPQPSPTTSGALTPTPLSIAPSPTPALVAEAGSAPTVAAPAPPDDEASRSLLVPLGYAVFALTLGALLGWLFLRMSTIRGMDRRG